jgi:hypothetical protein
MKQQCGIATMNQQKCQLEQPAKGYFNTVCLPTEQHTKFEDKKKHAVWCQPRLACLYLAITVSEMLVYLEQCER